MTSKPSSRALYVTANVLIGLIIIGAWEFASRALPTWALPGPSRVIPHLLSSTRVWHHARITLGNALKGVALALPLSVIIGFLAWRFVVPRGLLPYLVGFTTVPFETFAAVFILLFGVQPTGRVLLAAAIAFAYLTTGLYSALEGIDRSIVEAALVDGATGLSLLTHILLPLSMPAWIWYLRYAISSAYIAASVSELFGANAGIGYFLAYSVRHLNQVGTVAAALVSVVLVLGIYGVSAILLRTINGSWAQFKRL